MYSKYIWRLFCEPDGIQTHDLQNRNLTLYSAKLRVHCLFSGAKVVKKYETCKCFCTFLISLYLQIT